MDFEGLEASYFILMCQNYIFSLYNSEMWKRQQIRKHWKLAFSGGSRSWSRKISTSRHHLLLITKKVQKAKFSQYFCLFSQTNNVNLSKIELWTVLVMLKGQHFIIKIYCLNILGNSDDLGCFLLNFLKLRVWMDFFIFKPLYVHCK